MWVVKYDNDTGVFDDGFWEYWEITDGTSVFTTRSEKDAQDLCAYLNATEYKQTPNQNNN